MTHPQAHPHAHPQPQDRAQTRPQTGARAGEVRSRLMGLAATLGLLVFVAGTPLVLLAIGAVPTLSDFTFSRLTRPDDGTMALAVTAVVAWVAWAIFTTSVIVDVAARIRGIRAPRLPGLAVPQLAAGQLIGIAALLFASVPTVAGVATVTTAPRAAAAPLPAVPHTPPAVPSHAAADASLVAPTEAPTPSRQMESYTVKRGDSLWKIADERLGDGTRYVELLEINRTVLGDHSDFLMPGTVLQVPTSESPDEPEHEIYVVRPGDTLSQIAQDELGDADNYSEIFDASRGTVQSDGDHLTDPDLIRVGWHLTVPGAERDSDQAKQSHPGHEAAGPTTTTPPSPMPPTAGAPSQAPPTSPPESSPGSPQETPPTTRSETSQVQPGAAEPRTDGDSAAASDSNLPSWVLPGLAAGGAALAGCLLLTLRRHRRAQLRHRDPGTIIAPPPAALRPAEKSIQVSGAVTAPRIEVLDSALRGLPDTVSLLFAELSATAIHLTLAEPALLEAPWTGADTDWSIDRSSVSENEEAPPPFPLLASLGQSTDGALILVNLEQLRTITVQGDPDQAAALARHLTVELATAPWSQLVEIDTLGLGVDLSLLDPARVRMHTDGDTAFLDRISEDLQDSDLACAPDQFRIVVLADISSDGTEEVPRLAEAISTYPGRTALALIDFTTDVASSESVLHVAADGTLTCTGTGTGTDVSVRCTGLSVDEALACTRLVDLTREANPTPVPAPAPGDDAVADAAGALAMHLTQTRTSGENERSLLPAVDFTYADRAAVTIEELDRVAPPATKDAEEAIAAADPNLDEDLARWESPVPVAPKLTLLGPVNARVLGDPTRGVHRRPYFIELLAYLDLHPGGVTSDQVAEDLGIGEKKARSDLSTLRLWLGTEPRTGRAYLPAARKTTGEKAPYRLEGVLCDLDLFRRLRARGQSRGADGLDDLVAALHLVSGEPFTDLRQSGWGWLLEGERLDEVIRCAIVDVAHIVTTRALTETDLQLAQFASRVALAASPYDETARLDAVAVATGLGDDDRARELLRDAILDRSDDAYGPIEPPERTSQIISQKGWASPRQRRNS